MNAEAPNVALRDMTVEIVMPVVKLAVSDSPRRFAAPDALSLAAGELRSRRPSSSS